MEVTQVSGRAAILAAAGDQPYTRLHTGGGGDLTGYLLDDVTLWTAPGPHGRVGYAMGDPARAVRLVDELVAAGTLAGLRALHLPRPEAGTPTGRLSVTLWDDWDFHWAVVPPPVQPGEEDVVRLTAADHADIAALVDDSFPTSTTRPGDPRVNHWYGIRAGGRLVACGADRSRGGTGFLAGITVARDAWGRGLGAALTAAMTRALLAEAEEVTLGVMVSNGRARRLYQRLGFTGSIPRTSLRLA